MVNRLPVDCTVFEVLPELSDPLDDFVWGGRGVVRDTVSMDHCFVTSGSIKRDDLVRIIREGVRLYSPAGRAFSLDSLKRFTINVGEVYEGCGCDIKIAGFDDIKKGDVIEAFRAENRESKTP